MRDEISFLDRICFVSDPDLARSIENKKHFFIHTMVVKGECALPRWDHGHVVSELLRADFPANLSEHCALEFRLYRLRHGSGNGANSTSAMLMIGVVMHRLLAGT